MAPNYDMGNVRLDADGQMFFARELESVEKRVFYTQQEQLLATKYLAAIPGIDPFAAAYVSHRFTRKGDVGAKRSKAHDAGVITLERSEGRTGIVEIPVEFSYTVTELEQAMKAGIPLNPVLANAAVSIVNSKIDDLVVLGDAAKGIVGFASSTDVPDDTANITTADWTAATADQMIVEVNRIVARAFAAVGNIEMLQGRVPSFNLAVPAQHYAKLAQTSASSLNARTVMDFLTNSQTSMLGRIVSWPKLAGAGSGGTDRFVCWLDTGDDMVVGAVLPLPFRTLAPQMDGLSIKVPGQARCGGAFWRIAGAAVYCDYTHL